MGEYHLTHSLPFPGLHRHDQRLGCACGKDQAALRSWISAWTGRCAKGLAWLGDLVSVQSETGRERERKSADAVSIPHRVGAVDPKLSDKGYIMPGLGDTVRFRATRSARISSMLMMTLPLPGRPPLQHNVNVILYPYTRRR
jgi:hypothetical protein